MVRMQMESGVHGGRRFGRRSGSALILVVVLTVLLSIIGIVFVMMARIDAMATLAVAADRNLDDGVQTVVNRIETVLVDDLFGSDRLAGLADDKGWWTSNEAYDFAGSADSWLASLEPSLTDDGGTPMIATDDTYQWPHITELYGNFGLPMGQLFYEPDDVGDPAQWDGTPTSTRFLVSAFDVFAKVIGPDDPVKRVVAEGALLPWTDQSTSPGGGRAALSRQHPHLVC